jgi:tRNA (guanine9-N1)-methyltransferase
LLASIESSPNLFEQIGSHGSMTDPKQDAPHAESEHPPATLSKNAQKRLVRAARRTAQKSERRAREKARKIENKRLRNLETNDDVLWHKRPPPTAAPFDARVIIDLGFDELMTPKVTAM